MGIIFTCPECSKVYNFKEYLRGKKARCRDCNAIILIDDVDDVDVLSEDIAEESFELPPRTLGKKRRKKRKRSDFASTLQGLASNDALRQTLHILFGTTLGLIAVGSLTGFAVMTMGASGWFGRAGFIVHMGILLGSFLVIAACFVGAAVDVCRDDSSNLGSLPLMNLFTLLLYMLFSSNASQTRRYFFVACCWTMSFILATGFVRPQGGWGKYRKDADDWWINRPIEVPLARSPLPAAPVVPAPVVPIQPVSPAVAAAPIMLPKVELPNRIAIPFKNFRGSTTANPHATAIARAVLRHVDWIDAETVQVNFDEMQISMKYKGVKFNFTTVRQALAQGGFDKGTDLKNPQANAPLPHDNAPRSSSTAPRFARTLPLKVDFESYTGTKEATAAARDALRQVTWIDADSAQVNFQDKIITMQIQASVWPDFNVIVRALEKVGFQTADRNAKKKPPQRGPVF